MKRLTATEWALTKSRAAHLNLADPGPAMRTRMVEWLEARPGDGWFYTTGTNFHFSSSVDATAFRMWVVNQAAEA